MAYISTLAADPLQDLSVLGGPASSPGEKAPSSKNKNKKPSFSKKKEEKKVQKSKEEEGTNKRGGDIKYKAYQTRPRYTKGK